MIAYIVALLGTGTYLSSVGFGGTAPGLGT